MKTLNPVQNPFENKDYHSGVREGYDQLLDELEIINKLHNDLILENKVLTLISINAQKKLRNLWLKIIITLLFLVSLLSYFAITESNLIEKAQNLINNF